MLSPFPRALVCAAIVSTTLLAQAGIVGAPNDATRTGMPVIDGGKLPATAAGAPAVQVKATADFGAASEIGAFRTMCNPSHMAFNDPIVYPGQPNRSHLHTFFGNT